MTIMSVAPGIGAPVVSLGPTAPHGLEWLPIVGLSYFLAHLLPRSSRDRRAEEARRWIGSFSRPQAPRAEDSRPTLAGQ